VKKKRNKRLKEKELDTSKDRILDMAENLFSQEGFAAVSLREITREAKVNIAAIHYHFGGKEELMEAIFLRRMVPLEKRRLALLREAEKKFKPKPPDLEAILRAMIYPMLEMGMDKSGRGAVFIRLLGRCFLEMPFHPDSSIFDHFKESFHLFRTFLTQALPHLKKNPGELFWRMHFTLSTVHHAMMLHNHFPPLMGARPDFDRLCQRLIDYTSAGLKTPVPSSGKP
jgi:AcrR family transcriptional regulator